MSYPLSSSKRRLFCHVAIFTLWLSACKQTETLETTLPDNQGNTLILQFNNQYGDQDFEINKRYRYQAEGQQTANPLEISFDRLRYWVSNVRLIATDGQEVQIPDSYYLIEETSSVAVPHLVDGQQYPATKRDEVIIKNVPAGDYQGIKFSIGVAPKYNDNITLRSGELGLLNGMGFSDGWMWFTSYIFQKLDGQMYLGEESKSLRWDSGSNALYIDAEKSTSFARGLTLDARQGVTVDFRVDIQQLLSTTPNPWLDNTISQSKPDLMVSFRDALIQRAMQLVDAYNVQQTDY